MTIQETIKKAIEGGYINPFQWMENLIFLRYRGMGKNAEREVFLRYIFLDPDFWKCLGKAIGWEIMYRPYKSGSTRNFDAIQGWLYQWHRFIDHLAEGGTAEEFFKELK